MSRRQLPLEEEADLKAMHRALLVDAFARQGAAELTRLDRLGWYEAEKYARLLRSDGYICRRLSDGSWVVDPPAVYWGTKED